MAEKTSPKTQDQTDSRSVERDCSMVAEVAQNPQGFICFSRPRYFKEKKEGE